MSHLIPPLLELEDLPDELHLLCPRQTDDDQDRYEEDIQGGTLETANAGRRKAVENARERRTKFVACLQLLAYDGESSEKYQRIIWDLLDKTLGKCDICIKNYYIEKLHYVTKLREEYEESDVQQFFGLIDRRDIARIVKGLGAATQRLQAQPEQKRGTAVLEPWQLHALYEALLCDAFLRDEALITKHFDEPFQLVQTKKQLKIKEILPSTVRFLFGSNHRRLNWATSTWARLDRAPTELEWSWSIKEHLQDRLQNAVDPSSIARFWSGTMAIVRTLSNEMITHQLFDLQPNLCTAALDHLHQPTNAVPFITDTLAMIMKTAPKAFWQKIGPISTQTIAEQVFGSPRFTKALNETAASEEGNLSVLRWTLPLLSSLEVGNQPAACHALTSQLFNKLHVLDVTEDGKKACFEAAVKIMLKTVMAFSSDSKDSQPPGRLVANSVLKIIGDHLPDLLNPERVGITGGISEQARQGVLDIVRNSIALDCQCLKADFHVLSDRKTLGSESAGFAKPIWDTVISSLNNTDTALSSQLALGLTSLFGLEQFRIRGNESVTGTLAKQKLVYNQTFKNICEAVTKALEKIADFDPEHLDALYKKQETSMTLVAALFAAEEDMHQAAISLIKNISGVPTRKDALAHLLDAFFAPTMFSLSWTLRRIAGMGTFSSVPRMVLLCMDILDVLCNGSDGKLRNRRQVDSSEAKAILSYWSYQWIALRTIFQKMEPWSTEVHDKPLMTEVCRDTMQYAQALFEEYFSFTSVLKIAKPDQGSSSLSDQLLGAKRYEGKDTGSPVATISVMAKWLRLRDEFLADTLVKLLTNMLHQLKSHEVSVEIDGLNYVQEVAMPTSTVRTILSGPQKATLIRALEVYTGQTIAKPVKKKQSTLQMQQWAHSATKERASISGSSSRRESADEFGDDDILDSDLADLTKNYNSLQKDRSQLPSSKTASRPPALPKKPDPMAARAAVKKEMERKAFIEDRKRETEIRKQREKESRDRRKGKALGEGLGVLGKEHAAPAESSMMVSSGSESDSDEELLGKVAKLPAGSNAHAQLKRSTVAGPVRKIKQVRSQKDMRARLAPDLGGLHKTILTWDFFADSDLPPSSNTTDYTLVTNEFRTVQEYQRTFEPLLILEGWQSFRAAREDGTFKAFEMKVASQLMVDSFFEVNVSMSMAQGQELGLGQADVVLLSKSEKPTTDSNQPHCLARVKEINRQKGEFQIVFRVVAGGNPLRPLLHEKSVVWGAQILSLTTLEREYGALMALPYYDLSEEVIAAKPSPLLKYTAEELQPFMDVYDVNEAQAKAVKSAIDNDAFTLIQGPPGSGKTKTICALVGALMTGHLSKQQPSGPQLNTAKGPISAPKAEKRLLVAAPSNAAVDELVMRLKTGLKLADGSSAKINVVRLGRSDAINANVKDVTLEELVNAKLEASGRLQRDDPQPLMMEHKKVSTEIIELRNSLDQKRQKGEAITPKDEDLFDGLKRKQKDLGRKIDELKEKQKSEKRDADINRKRVQQEILDAAHVLCATLSGSGHDLFQGLNVEFETVIIDEAAQSIELSALIPLKYGASKCILVGDPKQLPPTVLSREAARYQYEQSLFARMEKNHKKNVHLLDTQYRMHPEISLFPSRTFYDSRLKDGSGMAKLRARPWHHSNILAPYRFFDIEGMSQSATKGHSLINIAEINIAMALYDRLITDVRKYDFRGKIGIITPYKGQLRELRMRFRNRYGEDISSSIEFNTTDAFQGRESEIIIFSCVRASTKGIGFLNDIRRMNVGLTRAKCSLWVLGNSQALNQGEFWRGLISDAKSRQLYTDGDIAGLLRKPLLTEDMMKDDVPMTDDAGTPEPAPEAAKQPQLETKAAALSNGASVPSRPASAVSRKSSSSSVSSVGRPNTIRRDSAKSTLNQVATAARDRSSSPSVSIPSGPAHNPKRRDSASLQGPSGGRFGLNDLAHCRICGSKDHFTFNCDNAIARESMSGNCRRCFEPGHRSTTCDAPRCIECGEVGHKAAVCTAPTKLRLSEEQKQDVRNQETRFKRLREQDIERRAKKQQGEHGAQIPVVKATLPENTPTEPKRKREEYAAANATYGHPQKAPKIEGADRRAGAPPGAGTGQGYTAAGPHVNGSGRPSHPPAGVVVKKKKTDPGAMFMKKK